MIVNSLSSKCIICGNAFHLDLVIKCTLFKEPQQQQQFHFADTFNSINVLDVEVEV